MSPEKQIYHCFGCGAGGNVFTFLMEFENISFPEAVRVLAKRYGIKIPRVKATASREAELLYRINSLAARVYRSALGGTKEGEKARQYLSSRGIDEKAQENFIVGYAPQEGSLLVASARGEEISGEDLIKAGVALSREGRIVDLFRRRIIFPIISAGGRILGFGGRVLEGGEPKYLNSPETAIFKKARTLYGIHLAKRALRREGCGVVVEGYLDAIALHANGLENTVASLGTAFTPEQATALRRYCGEVVLMYDGDEAGKVAAVRGTAAAASAGLKVRVVSLPAGEDPDSFIQKHGCEAVRKLVSEASHYIDFILSNVDPKRMEEAIRLILRIIARIEDPVRSDLDIKLLSERTGVSRLALERSLEAVSKEGGREELAENIKTIACDRVEKSIISILVELPEYIETVFEEISPEDFTDGRARSIAKAILERKARNLPADVSALVSTIEDEETRRFLLSCSFEAPIKGNLERIVFDHIICIKKRKLERQIQEVRRQIQAAEREGDAELLRSLLMKRQNLAKELELLSA